MKKIYLLLFAGFIANQAANAQTLTRAACEPVAGDIHQIQEYDSTSVIPRNTGANQTWNFSSMVTGTNAINTSTFIAASSAPSASAFPGATVAERLNSGTDYNFYKSATTPTTQFEILGSASTGTFPSISNYTNSAIVNKWPFSFGSTYNDTYGGPLTATGISGSYSGAAIITASGTGTITMPGGTTYTNILQVKTNREDVFEITSPFALSATNTATQYDYYEPSQKFPLLTIIINNSDDGTSIDRSVNIIANKMISVGIRDNNLDASYAIYPNPAKDNFSVKLSNASNEKCTIDIYSATGQSVKSQTLGNASIIEENVSITDLASGIYIVKVALGDKHSSRRLIVE